MATPTASVEIWDVNEAHPEVEAFEAWLRFETCTKEILQFPQDASYKQCDMGPL